MKKWESDLIDLIRKMAEKRQLAPEKIKELKKKRTAFIDDIIEPALLRIEIVLKPGYYLRRDKEIENAYFIDVFRSQEIDALFEFDILFDIADDALWVRLGSEKDFRNTDEIDEEMIGSTFTEQFKYAEANPELAKRRPKVTVI